MKSLDRRRWCTLAVIFMLAIVALEPNVCAQGVELGLLFGDIEFNQVSPAVAGYLDSNLVAGGDLEAVGCYVPGQFSAAVSAAYTVENQAPSANTRLAASFSLNPPVDAGGGLFLVEIDHLQFTDGAIYRFGSRQADSPAAQACPNVLPLADAPLGTECNLAECAGVTVIRLRLTGEADDLNALTDPVLCGVAVAAQDVPPSGPFSPQAQSGPQVMLLSGLRGPGVDVQVLVRGNAPIQITAGCASTPAEGEEGFALDPDTGAAVFGAEAVMPVIVGCGNSQTVQIDIPVERLAGDLIGMFDINGLDETSARIWLEPPDFFSTPPVFAAGAQPEPSESSSYWRFEDLLEGNYEVIATAIVDGGDTLIRPPTKGGANGPATIVAGQTTDLGATFISPAQAADGRVVLFDPSTSTELHDLRTQALTQLSAGFYYNSQTSRAEARGDSDVVPGADGGSGYHAYSEGRFRGSYDLDEGRGEFDYRLYLTGQSPEDGAADGSDGLRTAWDLRRLVLKIGQNSGNSQSIAIYSGQDHHWITEPGGVLAQPITIPEQSMCFGQLEVEIRSDQVDGSIFNPRLSIGNASISAPTAVQNVNYSASGEAFGTPRTSALAGPQAVTVATIPEGISYPVTPYVSFQADGSSSSQQIMLQTMTLPQSGAVGCGERSGVCLVLQGVDGEYTPLALAIEPDVPFCQQAEGGIAFNVSVDSGGAGVDFVTYTVDDGSPVLLCAPCGSDPDTLPPVELSDLTTLASGEIHSILVEAGSSNGCAAFSEIVFEIPDAPLDIQCSADFELYLESGEAGILGTDPRITENLFATAVGGCGIPVPVEDDRPPSFQTGDTLVEFSAGNVSCETSVSIRVSRQHLAFVDGNSVTVMRLEDDRAHFVIEGLNNPGEIVYSHDGEKLAIVERSNQVTGSVLVVDADDGGSEVVFGGDFTSAAFRPGPSGDIVFVESPEGYSMHGPYRLKVRSQALNGFVTSDILFSNQSWSVSSPEIGWSSDGSKITAVLDATHLGGNESRIFMYEWTFDGTTLVPTSSTWDWVVDRQHVKGVMYISNSVRLVATSLGLFSIGANGILNQTIQHPMIRVGLPQPSAAAIGFLGGLDSGLGVISDIGVSEGPVIEEKGGRAVAISLPLRLLAVAAPITGQVAVYGFEVVQGPLNQPEVEIVLDRSYPANAGQGLAFRPETP